jgi:hypothetical protein
MWNIRRSLQILGCAALTCAMLALTLVPAELLAQEHRHHPLQDLPLHEKFYSTWFMPDEPNKSCCNKADCYPTQVRFHGGQWWAMRREDGKYIPIPWKKVEINRNNPDGRNHLCAPPPSTYHAPDTVFCFALGGGI